MKKLTSGRYPVRKICPPKNGVSAFGFLSLDRKEDGQETDANWGFLDQRMAIKWVKENIQNFGGDPNNIMVFGQSAGGVSATAHLLHPPS